MVFSIALIHEKYLSPLVRLPLEEPPRPDPPGCFVDWEGLLFHYRAPPSTYQTSGPQETVAGRVRGPPHLPLIHKSSITDPHTVNTSGTTLPTHHFTFQLNSARGKRPLPRFLRGLALYPLSIFGDTYLIIKDPLCPYYFFNNPPPTILRGRSLHSPFLHNHEIL